MSWIAWFAAVIGGSFILWCAAAFLFHLQHLARFVSAVIVPAVVVAFVTWFRFFDHGHYSGSDAGWYAVSVIVCAGAGIFAAGVSAPVWYISEEKLGWPTR